MKIYFDEQFDHFFHQTTECLKIAEDLERMLAEIKARSTKDSSPVKKRVHGLPFTCEPHKSETSLLKRVFGTPEPLTG